MKLGSFKHTDVEKKRYTVSYAEWLASNEYVNTAVFKVQPVTAPPLVVTGSAIIPSGDGVTFYVSGGTEEQYQLNILMETDDGQRKEDYITLIVSTTDVSYAIDGKLDFSNLDLSGLLVILEDI